MTSRSHSKTPNLEIINLSFQKRCWELISHDISPSLILCDFPSEITDPQPHFKIFGLHDFPYFLHNIESSPDLQIIVLTQQYSILTRLISSTHSVQRPFKLLSRSHSAAPFELKIIEISSVVPINIFQKATQILYRATFPVRLTNAKGPFIKHFDLFELHINPIIENVTTISPIPSHQICGFAHTTNYNLYKEISQSLQDFAIPYSHDNNLQASVLPLSHIISFNITPASPANADTIQSLLDQLSSILDPIPSFIFCALISGIFSLVKSSYINFISKRRMDPSIITPIFSILRVPFLIISSGLIFVASLELIEEVLLLAPQHNITIPSHFLQHIQKFTFELTGEFITISLLKITTPHFTDLQILRLDPGCPSEIFFTQHFLDFLHTRFSCNSGAQLQTIRDGTGNIHEVLAFSSSIDFSSNDSDLTLPFPFVFQSHNFLISYLEPSFSPKPKSVHQYPFESSDEHFERFTNVSNSLAARIPIVRPHEEKGGPIASQIIAGLLSGTIPDDSFPLSFLTSSTTPLFHILLAPFPDSWQTLLLDLLPSSLTFQSCKMFDIGRFSPQYIIIDLPPRSQFPIPFLPPSGTNFSECGWLTVSSFSNIKLVYQLLSTQHLKIFVKFLSTLKRLTPASVTLALTPPPAHAPPSPPSPLPTNSIPTIVSASPLLDLDVPMGDDPVPSPELPPPPSPLPPLPPCAELLVTCYRLLTYLTWSHDYDHPKQRLLEVIAGGRHLGEPHVFLPYLTGALDTFPENFFNHNFATTFVTIALDLPLAAKQKLFHTIHEDASEHIQPIISLPSFPPHSTSSDISLSFDNIFSFLPEDVTISTSNSTFLFSSPHFSDLPLPTLCTLLESQHTISLTARARTSDHNRGMVLRLSCIMIELNRQMNSSTHSTFLFIERFHPVSNSVTVFDPFHGTQLRQINSLICYKIATLVFKRNSVKSLVCSSLLQNFANTFPASPPTTAYSPFCVISLFDGSGSFTDVIAKAVGSWPHAILAAEMDAGTRSVVSKVKGWSVEGSIWTKDKKKCSYILCGKRLVVNRQKLSPLKAIPLTTSRQRYNFLWGWISLPRPNHHRSGKRCLRSNWRPKRSHSLRMGSTLLPLQNPLLETSCNSRRKCGINVAPHENIYSQTPWYP